MSNLTATPPTVAFGDLEQGKGHHFAMVMQLHSPNAADAVELRTHCTDPRLSVEAVRYKQGAVRVSVLCSSAGLVQGTIVCTAPGGSIRVPISARVLEPSQYKALHDSTPARMQTKPSGFVETLEADDEPPSATADVHRRPVVHVRALRFDDGVTAPQRRRPAATVPLVWTETDPALRTDPGPGPSVSPREHRAVDRMQVSEGAVHQAREAREVAGAQHSLARLVQHLNGLKGALARAEQKGQVPAAVAAQLQGLQGEMERLDPLIADAESFFNRQQSAGLRRAAAMQKAQLAPATIEEASRSEKHALQSLAKEQAKVLALEAKLAEAAEREKKAEARSVQQQARMAGLEQSLERAKAHGLKMSAAAEEAKARLAPVQKECEGMRAQIRRIAEKAEEENKGQHEVAALKSQLKAEQEEVEKLRKTTVPKVDGRRPTPGPPSPPPGPPHPLPPSGAAMAQVEAESAQKTAAYYKEQMEQAKEEALALRQQQTDLAGAAKLDHEWRASALQVCTLYTLYTRLCILCTSLCTHSAPLCTPLHPLCTHSAPTLHPSAHWPQLLERITKWSKRADVASKLPDPAEHFKASGDPFMARSTEDWLGTLATMVAEAERTRGMAEVLPRGGKPQGGGQIAGMYAQLDEGRKTHRAKLIAGTAPLGPTPSPCTASPCTPSPCTASPWAGVDLLRQAEPPPHLAGAPPPSRTTSVGKGGRWRSAGLLLIACGCRWRDSARDDGDGQDLRSAPQDASGAVARVAAGRQDGGRRARERGQAPGGRGDRGGEAAGRGMGCHLGCAP